MDLGLEGRVCVVTGASRGIGLAVSSRLVAEGARVLMVARDEERLSAAAEDVGADWLAGDVTDAGCDERIVATAVEQLGGLDVLVNNAGEQHPQGSIEDITAEQLERTFRTNVFAYFFMAKHALPHLKEGSAVINTASVQAYKGNPTMLDYGATKGAEVTFTRALSKQLIEKGIRVNAVAPGPVWTPLIPSTMPEKTENFGEQTPMGRAGEPAEIAPCYVFLACDDSCYMSGQVLHPNGGDVIGG
jgi:NAD(P)-dependent dehydrogenase (short-subunit alcohol dehydrogenase family)